MKKYLLVLVALSLLLMPCVTQASISSTLGEDFVKKACTLKVREAGRKGRPHPHMSLDQGFSLNWSGYAASKDLQRPSDHSVTHVKGSWVVPTLKPTPGNTTYTSIWVGIDGYNSSTVEQLGTEHDWVNDKQEDSAWFEMFPLPAYTILGFPLQHGDLIEAEVDYEGKNQFKLSLVNHTQKTYCVIPLKHTKSKVAKRSSAEWIVEAPYSSRILPLSDFQQVRFKNCEMTLGGITGGIENKNWETEFLVMQNADGVTRAVPSGLSYDSKNFSVKWDHI